MDNAYESVLKFHQVFGHPVSEKPRMIDSERVQKRALWFREEIDEFICSTSLEDQADAIIDLIYFAFGALVEMGVKPQQLFDIVHNANMKKLWPDGLPHYNSDGKVIKPNDWKDPENEIKFALDQQLKGGAP